LKGEGLLAKGRPDEARREFGDAVRVERDATYLDGQGRATEAAAAERNDSSLYEQALNAYKAATEIDPLLFTSFLGQGRIYVHRLEMAPAVKALAAAQQIRAEDPEVAYLLGLAYQRLGSKKDKALAVKWLEFSLARKRNADAAYNLGELYMDPDIDKGGPAQNAYRRAISTWDRQEKDGKPFTQAEEKNRVDALWKLGNVSELIHDEATQKWAWERWAGLPAAKREPVKLQNVLRALQTSLKSVGAPPPEPEQPPQ
jgi:TPR repeat protein